MRPDIFLKHYGVIGMRWGVRKDSQASSKSDWSISDNGEINIKKGAVLSRVVRNHKGLMGGKGVSLESGKPIYAAFKQADVAGYEYFFGRGKNLLVKDASTVLKLEAKEPLKAPGPKEAARLYFDMINDDSDAQKTLYDNVRGVAKMQFKKSLNDPSGKEAYNLYTLALDGGNYDKKLNAVNVKYYEAVKKAGYNMLLDASDATLEFDSPVIILDGKKSLGIKSQYLVDKITSNNARMTYNQSQINAGKTYLQLLGYV